MNTIQDTLDFLQHIYPSADLAPESAAAWGSALWDLHPLVIFEAALEYTREPETKFFPTPGDILRIAKGWESSFMSDRLAFAAHLLDWTPEKVQGGLLAVVTAFGRGTFAEMPTVEVEERVRMGQGGDKVKVKSFHLPSREWDQSWERANRKVAQLKRAREKALERGATNVPTLEVAALKLVREPESATSALAEGLAASKRVKA